MSQYVRDKDPQVLAAEAQQLLDNPLLKATFQELEELFVDQMKTVKMIGNPLANEFRDKLILSLQAVGLVQMKLEEFVMTGHLEALKQPKE